MIETVVLVASVFAFAAAAWEKRSLALLGVALFDLGYFVVPRLGG